MKTKFIILALAAAGFLGQSAFGDTNNGPWAYTITPTGHGSFHCIYYQDSSQTGMSVALVTNSGGVTTPMPLPAQTGPLPDNGQTRFVIGNNQHAQARCAYIPLSSNFAPATQ